MSDTEERWSEQPLSHSTKLVACVSYICPHDPSRPFSLSFARAWMVSRQLHNEGTCTNHMHSGWGSQCWNMSWRMSLHFIPVQIVCWEMSRHIYWSLWSWELKISLPSRIISNVCIYMHQIWQTTLVNWSDSNVNKRIYTCTSRGCTAHTGLWKSWPWPLVILTFI